MAFLILASFPDSDLCACVSKALSAEAKSKAMGKTKSFLAMRTDYEDEAIQLINSDLRDLARAAANLANHAVRLGGLGFGTAFFQWLASISAMYEPSNYFYFYSVSICLLCGKSCMNLAVLQLVRSVFSLISVKIC